MALFDYPGTALEGGSADDDKPPDEVTLLADISRDDWSRILKLVETRHFRAGEVLVRTGEADDAFYILTSGEVVVVVERDGRETVLATISEGSVFGEIAFFDRAPRSATIRARTSGAVLRVTHDNFEALAAWEPAIARRILFDLGRIVAMRLRWTTKQLPG